MLMSINRAMHLLAWLSALLVVSTCAREEVGPKYPASKGELWPRPLSETRSSAYFTLDPSFNITTEGHTCRIVEKAVVRYRNIVGSATELAARAGRGSPSPEGDSKGPLQGLKVVLLQPCEEYPYLGMDESYNLTVTSEATLTSGSVWGVLRGLESFSQLLYLPDDYSEVRIRETDISDAPRFPHRGLHLDTSRHFISLEKILTILDAMAYNKMNVFHWHIVDDQSFPYQSKRFPELSERGAYSEYAVYSPRDVALVVEYARLRGVRVLPEFDMPGHSRSWGEGYKELLTQCYRAGKPEGLGPMNPIQDSTYSFLRDLLDEVKQVFPDQFIHVGGDEVDTACWDSNPEIKDFKLKHPGSKLETMFLNRLVSQLPSDRNAVVWEEAFYGGVNLPNDTIVQKWKFWNEKPNHHQVTPILQAGHRVVYSSALYLDYVKSSDQDPGDWWKYYQIDLEDKVEGSAAGVVGGEACMWAEGVDDTNVISRVWPRASATAEKLWSPRAATTLNFNSPDDVARVSGRLQEHTCRMRRRGIAAQPPSGPGYCLTLPDLRKRQKLGNIKGGVAAEQMRDPDNDLEDSIKSNKHDISTNAKPPSDHKDQDVSANAEQTGASDIQGNGDQVIEQTNEDLNGSDNSTDTEHLRNELLPGSSAVPHPQTRLLICGVASLTLLRGMISCGLY